MKKHIPITSCICSLLLCCITCFVVLFTPTTAIQASTPTTEISAEDLLERQAKLTADYTALSEEVSTLKSELLDYKSDLKLIQSSLDATQEVLVSYYIDHLSSPDYTSIYNEEYIWYTAAECLGRLGKAAIPQLVSRIDTPDDYERTLVFYSLLLASQAEDVKVFAEDNYIDTRLDFDVSTHDEQRQTVVDWWAKYEKYF